MGFLATAVILLALGDREERLSVAIQPLGNVSSRAATAVKQGLETTYGVRVSILKTTPLPREAYYKPRNRYRADRLLTFLARTPGSYDKVLGLTARDISTTKEDHYDWGIFGLGQLPGKACVLSSFRLQRKGPKTPTQRLTEVAIHELGHTLGLPHCPTARCVMADAAGSIKTVDISTGKPCEKCRDRLQ